MNQVNRNEYVPRGYESQLTNICIHICVCVHIWIQIVNSILKHIWKIYKVLNACVFKEHRNAQQNFRNLISEATLTDDKNYAIEI